VLDKNVLRLLNKKHVVSVGYGYKKTQGRFTGGEAIVVGVNVKLPQCALSIRDLVPETIGGIPTDVQEVGEIKFLDFDPTQKYRPAMGGTSIGHYLITGGTFGGVVYRRGEPYILSNNHVLANVNEAQLGDAIYQPGPYDGGDEFCTIGTLFDYVKIDFSANTECLLTKVFCNCVNFVLKALGRRTRLFGYRQGLPNIVDCALAQPISSGDIQDSIAEIGKPLGEVEPQLGMKVKKCGRTTGFTEGLITQLNATISVNMGEGRTGIFDDQFIIEGTGQDFSAGGDSGSFILSEDNKKVGLLFAGSGQVTCANKFSNVRRALLLDE